MTFDPFGARDRFDTGNGTATLYRLSRLEEAGLGAVSRLPFSIRLLLEAVLRNCDGFAIAEQDVKNLAAWNASAPAKQEVPFKPYRVVLQDFTGVPAVVDLAAMRSAMERIGGDPNKINPLIPVDLVIDHSVQVDFFGSPTSLAQNVEIEFQRNRERYEFLRWGQKAFKNFEVVPPNVGIVHQVNLEYLARVVGLKDSDDGPVAAPDTLVGTDSHTTMINGLGVLGWGVGGIEAEANMLGQPLYMLMPEVIGFELTGALPAGATATDMVLRVTEILRQEGVVGKFVEFFGAGMSKMGVADRATIANMAPEYGATIGFFPVDDLTLEYLRQTGRTAKHVELVERYTKEQGLFRRDGDPTLDYTKVLSLDLSTVEPSLAGPKRPQDRVSLAGMKDSFRHSLTESVAERGFGLDSEALKRTAKVIDNGHTAEITHGSVVIAAITSCTNTSNPSVMIGAGILAKRAVERGLKVARHVKTSLAPGSRVVTDYLDQAGLSEALNQLGFNTVGYGCTTCIGNSGPLPKPVADAIDKGDLVASAVLSGNRNFEGRVNPLTKANYLASPPLVVAYALAGTTDVDLVQEPLGQDPEGNDVFLRDLWPSTDEIRETIASAVKPEMFTPRIRRGGQGERALERHRRRGRGDLPVGRVEHVHPPPAVPRCGEGPNGSRHRPDPRRPCAGVAWRFGDHRPHLSGRRDRHRRPGGSVFEGTRGRDPRLQQFRVSPWERQRDGPRYVRQHPDPKPAGPGHRRGRHATSSRRRADEHLRRVDEVPGRRDPVGRAGGDRVRHRQQSRLGRQGDDVARGEGRDRRQLRTDPPQQPSRDGRVAAGIRRRRDVGIAGINR